LRGSGQIEEASDIIALVYRPEYYGIEEYEDGEKTLGLAEFRIDKGRSIGLSRTKLRFTHHLTKFEDYRRESSPLTPNYNDPF
jgi:replicative DNA helicase